MQRLAALAQRVQRKRGRTVGDQFGRALFQDRKIRLECAQLDLNLRAVPVGQHAAQQTRDE